MHAWVAVAMMVMLAVFALCAFVSLPGEMARRLMVSFGAANFLAMMSVFGVTLRDRRSNLPASLILLPILFPCFVIGGGLLVVAWFTRSAAVYIPMTIAFFAHTALTAVAVLAPPRKAEQIWESGSMEIGV